MAADLSKPFSPSCCDGGASAPHGSAQNCGCDPGAGHVCEWHLSGQFAVGNPLPIWGPPIRESALPAGQNPERTLRTFETGATRNTDDEKIDYEGFLSPLVLERFGRYMDKHRIQADGSIRASDNWQKGIPREVYMKSAWRHFVEWWKYHRFMQASSFSALHGTLTPRGHEELEDALCALLFNAMGYLHEHLKAKP